MSISHILDQFSPSEKARVQEIISILASEFSLFEQDVVALVAAEKAKKTVALSKVLLGLDKEIAAHFNLTVAPNENVAAMWLNADIPYILLKQEEGDREKAEEYIKAKIDATGRAAEIYKVINWNSIKEKVKIRSDFASALRRVKNGAELAGRLDWSFSDDDLRQLTALHRKNRFRQKIEDLLTDANFHSECILLQDRKYDELLAGLTE